MNRKITASVLIAALTLASAVFAGPREDQLSQYASAAKASTPAFAGFSAARGEALHQKNFAAGRADTPSCTSCHGADPLKPGRSTAGKTLDPVALSVSPSRYTDAAKVEKWFKRNCNEVLGRECTPLEKGDWLTFVTSR
jgi:hypothetical protein